MNKLEDLQYEQGPIRPPSEAGSLLIRVTRNCPWNRCVFCSTYKRRKFSRRPIEEIKLDIDKIKRITEEIQELSIRRGDNGRLTQGLLSQIFADPSLPDTFGSVALWIGSGATTVFLQDANTLMLSTDKLLEVLQYLKSVFPQIERITSYARAGTLKAKSVEDYIKLKNAGLSRLHVGMESGSDRILKLISKGATSGQLIEGGRKVVEAGISLSLYIIPGIGGVELSSENALESARVVNAVNPAYVRFRSLYVKKGSDLWKMVEAGDFSVPNEDQIVQEIRLFISKLEGITTTIVSDHILNLLEEIEGKLPEDKDRLLALTDRYLNAPEEDRLLFQLGRRGGALHNFDDLYTPAILSRLKEVKKRIDRDTPGGVAEYIRVMKTQFV